ncbi:tautomerase family protein [Streptomyces sp. NBC_01497]|uniref:tautomerase family protein n=1 Tax=Streptomyces sp. NBC_01497 TaxID=2903885 RepID=UPI002E2EDBAA|nr:tautomerase family protein [Streptomyces sp. NBC_01497]
MPLLFFDIFQGWKKEDIQNLLDVTHRVVVEAFQVPKRDRYQVVNLHGANEMIALDTGLGISRTEYLVIIHVVSRPRPLDQKQRFYGLLGAALNYDCGIDSADLIVSITENANEDWSFGYGRAQFLTGELS